MLNKINYRIPLNTAQGQQVFSGKKEDSSKTLQKVLAIGIPTVLVIGAAIAYYYSKSSSPLLPSGLSGSESGSSVLDSETVAQTSLNGGSSVLDSETVAQTSLNGGSSVLDSETVAQTSLNGGSSVLNSGTVDQASFESGSGSKVVRCLVSLVLNRNESAVAAISKSGSGVLNSGTVAQSSEIVFHENPIIEERVSQMIFGTSTVSGAPAVNKQTDDSFGSGRIVQEIKPDLTRNEIVDKSAGAILSTIFFGVTYLCAKMRFGRR